MRLLYAPILSVVLLLLSYQVSSQQLPCKEDIRRQMIKVADYQLAQPWPENMLKSHPLGFGDRSWRAGAYYIGIYEAYRTTGKKEYLDRLVRVGEANAWRQGPRIAEADDQAILQLYLALYGELGEGRMLAMADTMAREMLRRDSPDFYPWSWSDALFMAPSVMAAYAKITGKAEYLDFMDRQWWKTVDDLYNEKYKLFYRDARFKTMEADNGKPIFWGRGNGWVIAGLARVLEFMPANYPKRKDYEMLYQDFCDGILAAQQSDGFWKASLLDPGSYPAGETSATVFFCYGLAWGVNHGVLNKKDVMPAIEKAWAALTGAIHPDGRLGYVQGGGDRPWPTDYDQTEFYAVGGFMLAGSEVIKLAPKKCK